MKQIRVLAVTTALTLAATAVQAQRGHDDQRPQRPNPGARIDQVHQRDVKDQRGAHDVQDRRVDQQRVGQQRVDQQRNEQQRADQQRNEQQRADQQRNEQQRNEQQRFNQQRNDQQRIEAEREHQRNEQIDRERDMQRLELQRREQQEQLERARERVVYSGRNIDNRYRYRFGTVYRETNEYGADALRQAVDRGYQEGYRAGLDDRRGRLSGNFERAFEFRENGLGYAGAYIPAGDYRYYLREGFQRGYDDAYSNRAQYGTYNNGNPSILGAIAAGILGLTLLR